MLSLQDYKKSKDVRSLVEKMFEARHVAHVFHFKTKSFAEHEALGSFYTGLLDLADEFVETYQGQYGLMGDIGIQVSAVDDVVKYLEDCMTAFKFSRESIKDSHLQNILDEMLALGYRTIYKLKNLK